jgi:hypothetical protein
MLSRIGELEPLRAAMAGRPIGDQDRSSGGHVLFKASNHMNGLLFADIIQTLKIVPV